MKIGKLARRVITILTIVITTCATIFFSREFISNYFVRLNMNNMQLPEKGSRVIIFSPHNDDEVLGTGEFIKKSIENGAKVKVVLITNGDGFKSAIQLDYLNPFPKQSDFVKFGYTRQQESIDALKRLGLSKEDIIFLGYPDGGIAYLWNYNWDKSNPYTSSFTQSNKSPYSNSYTKGAAYAGESVVNDMTKIIRDYKPNYIAMPHPNDRHPDHWAVNAFVEYTLTTMNYTPEKLWLYLVHRGDWPTPLERNTSLYLVPPKKLIGIGTNWYALDMDSNDIEEKAQAIQNYKTQFRALKPLITAFERKNELLGEYPNFKSIKNVRNDNEIKPEERNKIITDPLQDTLTLQISRNSDITGVYAEVSKENNLHIFLETDSGIEDLTNYNVNAVLFNKDKTSRINLKIKDNKMMSESNSSISITNIEGSNHSISGKFIHIIIPGKSLGEFNHMFINATTSVGEHILDKTAWRMVDVK